MIDVTAKLSNLQTAPRKVRLLANLIKGLSVEQARQQLRVSAKHVALPLLKLVNSAVANAEHNFQVDASTLRIKSITVGDGRKLKRYQPRSFGKAALILRRASHVYVVLEGEKSKSPAKKKPIAKTANKSKKNTEDQPKVKKEAKGRGVKGFKKEIVDPRGLGHQRPTQHKKDKSGIVKV